MKKRWLAILMAVMMAISLLPTGAWAEETPQAGSGYADLPSVNYFYFMSSTEDDAIVVATKVLHEGDNAIDDLSDVVVPLDGTQGVSGWYADKGCETPVTSLSYDAERTGNVHLYPKIESGFWITFDSNGGTYIAPQFFAGTDTATAPTDPTKFGYDFAGWYTDEALDTAADFAEISNAITVYAKWDARTDTRYTVIHWLENADDDGYSYQESEYMYGTTGGQTAAVAKNTEVEANVDNAYTGFTAQPITQQAIKGDGTTIVNVYYTRNEYEIKFWLDELDEFDSIIGHTELTDKNIKAKFGANIADKWPGGSWRVSPLRDNGIWQANIKVMPLNGANYYRDENYSDDSLSANGTEYLTEKLDGDGYESNHVVYLPLEWGNVGITQEDCYEIKGFTFKEYTKISSFYDKADKKTYDEYRGAKFYYTRNSYKVAYMNKSKNPVKETLYKYEADISNAASFVPDRPYGVPENYVFSGWYADEACAAAYDFAGKTMPADNVTVYANWVPPICKVDFIAYGETVKTLPSVPYGTDIANDIPTITLRENDAFYGWTYDALGTQPFNSATLITQSYTLYAQIGNKNGYTVTYDANGGGGTVPTDPHHYAMNKAAMVLSGSGLIAPAGKVFNGWSTASDGTGTIYQPGDSIPVSRNITLYAVWRSSGGGGGGGGSSRPTLNTEDHFGYIIGYPVDYFTGEPTTDQTKKPVRPQGEITRAEVATIFFRMLTDESRTQYWSQESGYSDVAQGQWFNAAVSTLSKAGIISGYPDGSFRPNGSITRAEFATIAVRFFDVQYDGAHLFPDIDGHWAQDYIDQAGSAGLVNGYPDGTFGPDRSITRAEAVTLVNRTLDRHPDPEHFLKDMLVWPDNRDTTAWYYADMQEATNSHQYEMKTDSDKTKYEVWTKMLPIRDWEAFEKAWSDAGSASNPGEVVNK